MYLPVAFLSKDFLFLVVSFYLLKQDFTRVAMEIEPIRSGARVKRPLPKDPSPICLRTKE
jgi:hypothetical protein